MSNLLEQASLVMIPSGYKEDIVYSVIPTSGAGDLSFTRASNGTRINSAGLVEDVPWNLVEYSEQFDNAAWVKSASATTITTNSTTAPNGTTTADTWTINAAGARYVGQTKTVTAGAVTASFFVKKGTSDWFYIRIDDGTNYAGYTFDVATGQLGQSVSSVLTPIASIVDFGNGWYRCIVATTVAVTSITVSGWVATSATTISGLLGASLICWGAQLNIGSTAKPYFPTTDRLNVPRLTYQNGGGGCPSLLLEKQSTNLVTYSEQFDNGAWSKSGVTVTANDTTSPDGTQNADKVVENTANSSHGCYQGATVTNGIPYTWSGFIKAGERTKVRLYAESSSAPYVSFNLSDGTITNTSGSITGSIENFGNGWYRCIATTTTTGTTAYFNINALDASGNISYTGDGTSGFYIWGAQIEASSYPTSYIPTTSSSATRVADACFKTGISSLIGQSEGVLFADVNVNITGTAANFAGIAINDGTSSNAIGFGYYQDGRIQAVSFVSGSLVVNINLPSFGLTSGSHKFALAYKLNDYVLYVDGVQVGSDTSASVPATSVFLLSDLVGADISYNQAILFPTRLTNAELAQLTGNQNYTINQAYASYGVASESPNCVQP
jgi:hypothetical protein